jgi:microcystin-dependent protein
MVVKLLGDPTYFPIEFRRWLEDFLDNSDFKVSQSQIIGGGAGGGSTNPSLLPAGIILPYAGNTYGKDCLPCNGASISRADYKELFDAIGVVWGSSDGQTFKVPDLRDRALYGVGSVVSLGATDGKSLGNRGGPNHHHDFSGNTSQAGGHSHSWSGSVSNVDNHAHSEVAAWIEGYEIGGTQGSPFNTVDPRNVSTGYAGAHGHSVSGSVSSAPNHNHSVGGSTSGGYDQDKPSFAGIQYVITTGRSSAT